MQTCDLVLFSSAIFDSIKDEPFPGGVAVKDGKILAVGPREEIEGYIGADTVVKDFGDSLIMPGIIDAHSHFDGTARKWFAEVVNGLEELHSEEECVAAVKKFADEHPHLERINSNSWILTSWGIDPVPPTKASLDAVLPDKPVYLFGADGHTMWLNSAAIEECKLEDILAAHPEYPEGWATRDENGELTGVIAEDPVHTVEDIADVVTPELRDLFHEKTVKKLNSYGITGFTDLTPIRSREMTTYYSHLKEMDNRGDLTVRIYIWNGKAPKDDDTTTQQAEDIRQMIPYFNTDRLMITGIKTIYDGIPFSTTSALLNPYTDSPDTKGEFLTDPSVYADWVTKVNAMGFSVKCHCTGDAAIRAALDSFEASLKVNGDRDYRNSIEHMDIVSLEDIPRFAELGVIASVQPAHVCMCKGIWQTRYKEAAKHEWPFRTLINAGARISIGTDTPVVEANPYYTIYKAITRRDIDGTAYSPDTDDEALTLPEVLKGYTIGAAYNQHFEDKVGTLEPGKYADICVVDKNLFAIPATDIKDCNARCTVFEGRIVYEA